MFRWTPFPFLRIAIFFITGILAYDQLPSSVEIALWGVFLVGLTLFILSTTLHWRLISGITGLITVLVLGTMHAYYADPTHHDLHITHHFPTRMDGFTATVQGNEVEKDRYFRYDIAIHQVKVRDSIRKVTGSIHLYLYKKDSFRLTAGDELYIDYFFSSIPQPKNPAEFNYSDYVKKSGIYGQCFVRSDQLLIIKSSAQSDLYQRVLTIRGRARQILNQVIHQSREQQIAQALLLGIKDYLDQEVKTAYASVGAMHVLAVSGLHVGIIYLILLALLKPLRLLPYGSYFIFILLITGIWLYALLTGFSPSVMRAATMFSVVSLKEISIRRANIYNSLGLAAIVILLIRPDYLFAVGFQLSFIAVFGIVHLYPIIHGLWQPSNWVLQKVWTLSGISLAAQLATFPLSMYYFNQFPVYFLVSNLVVIPGAFVLLLLGLFTIVLGFISTSMAQLPGYLLDSALYMLNESVFTIDQLPFSLITGLYISSVEVWLCYAAMILFLLSIHYRSYAALVTSMIFLMLQMGSIHWRHWHASQQQLMVFYEIPEKTAVDFVDGRNAHLILSEYESEGLELLEYQIDPFRRMASLKSITAGDLTSWEAVGITDSIPMNLLVWNGVRLMIINRPLDLIQLDQKVKTDILLISRDAVSDLDQLDNLFDFKQLLISSDCSSSIVRKLAYQARLKQIKLHSLTKDGHWVLDLNKPHKL